MRTIKILAYSLMVSVSAASSLQPAGAQEVKVQSAEEAWRGDAQAYSALHSISVDEAVRRLKLENEIGDHISTLRDTYRSRLAGIYVEHKPEYRLVVRLTGDQPIASVTTQTAAGAVRTDFLTGAPATQAQLQAAIDGNLAGILQLLPTLQGVGANEQTGRIVLDVYATGLAADQARSQTSALQALLGHPVQIRTFDAKFSSQAVRGGSRFQDCTSGFVAKLGTEKGPLTAGHCANTLDYYDLVDGSAYTFTATYGRNDASHDVQWHPATAYSLPQFYADTATPRVLTGKRLQSGTALGSTVCHRGDVSLHSCGSVENIAYKIVDWMCGPNNDIVCAATWVQVGGSTLKCAGGDSGGPWFAGQTALGIHTGGSFNTATGYCYYSAYMSTDRITGMSTGFTLAFGP